MQQANYANEVEKLKIMEQSRKVRSGMIYAVCAAPMLGIAFGLAGIAGTKPPFSMAFPTGSVSFQMFEYMFAVVLVLIYSLVRGSATEHFKVFRSRISGWAVFIAMVGCSGDLMFFSASALISGAIISPIASIYGLWGAILSSLLYREKLLNKWTVIGVVCVVLGLFIISGGASMVLPEGISTKYLVIGLIMGFLCAILWGMENFAIAAGADFMPEESVFFWRAAFALIAILIVNFVIMPKFTTVATDMFSSPTWWAFAAIAGSGWGLFMMMGNYLSINLAGAINGGTLASTGFVWSTIFTMLVYRGQFSGSVLAGTLVLFAGIVVFIVRPSKTIASLRS